MKTNFDAHRARAETPGCQHVLHFNNAGSSLMPLPVFEAHSSYLKDELRFGGYETHDRYAAGLDQVYVLAAQLLNARRESIAILENATRAWDMAVYSIPFEKGDRILVHSAAYASNYIALLQLKERYGLAIEHIPSEPNGQVDVSALATLIDDRVRLIAITHIPTNGGLVNPAEAIGQLPRPEQSFYMLDACQSAGQIPLDVEAIGCDFLSTTSRKYLRGPRGMGLLFARASRVPELEPVLLDLHAATWSTADSYTIRPDARRFENWESNFAAKYAFGRAIRYALEWGLAPIEQRVTALAHSLRSQLNEIDGLTVYDLGQRKSGIVTFGHEDVSPAAIKAHLAAHSAHITTSSVYSTRLDMESRGLDMVARASVHYYNDHAEIDRFCELIRNLVTH
jgi:selenocysteine lyase/cysteine desulfurase